MIRSRKETVLFIDYSSLPEVIKQYLIRDSIVLEDKSGKFEFCSPLKLYKEISWESILTLDNIENHYKYYNEDNLTGEQYFSHFSLEIEKYLVDQNLDLSNVDRIIFEKYNVDLMY